MTYYMNICLKNEYIINHYHDVTLSLSSTSGEYVFINNKNLILICMT